MHRGGDARATIESIRRRNHLQVLLVGWVVYVVDVGLSWNGTWGYGGDAPERLLFILLGAVFIVRLLVRRAVARGWELAGFVLLTAAFLAHLFVSLTVQGLSASTLLSAGLWLYLVYVYAFYVLSARGARWFTGATWALAWLVGLPAALSPSTTAANLAAFIQFQGGGLVAVILASALAVWRTALGEAQARVQEAERESLTDLLTAQANRRGTEITVRRELARARRTGETFGLILLDIDHFKDLNDAYGHRVGDAVLSELARVVRDTLRTEDELGRWGGEEFVVVAPNTGPEEGLRLAERLRERLEAHRWQAGSVTASFGVTVHRRGDDLEQLVRRADAAMYRAKALGRNRCELEPAALGGDGDAPG
jgi:diguanylate cyclase (GGDEF)-like protein